MRSYTTSSSRTPPRSPSRTRLLLTSKPLGFAYCSTPSLNILGPVSLAISTFTSTLVHTVILLTTNLVPISIAIFIFSSALVHTATLLTTSILSLSWSRSPLKSSTCFFAKPCRELTPTSVHNLRIDQPPRRLRSFEIFSGPTEHQKASTTQLGYYDGISTAQMQGRPCFPGLVG